MLKEAIKKILFQKGVSYYWRGFYFFLNVCRMEWIENWYACEVSSTEIQGKDIYLIVQFLWTKLNYNMWKVNFSLPQNLLPGYHCVGISIIYVSTETANIFFLMLSPRPGKMVKKKAHNLYFLSFLVLLIIQFGVEFKCRLRCLYSNVYVPGV